jgi:HAD superfamily hydrolase (TIGR01509 family)
MPIKNLIFDLGGVIIDLHVHKTREAFQALGMGETANWFVANQQASLLNAYETGKLSSEDFIAGINKESGLNISDEQFYKAWTTMLGKVKSERIHMLKELRDKYRVYALSNINAMHAHACHTILQRDHDIFSFHEIFDLVFYSHEIGARKPEPEAWQKVLERTGILPEETLFIDDHLPNVEAAAALGFQTKFADREILEIVNTLGL